MLIPLVFFLLYECPAEVTVSTAQPPQSLELDRKWSQPSSHAQLVAGALPAFAVLKGLGSQWTQALQPDVEMFCEVQG